MTTHPTGVPPDPSKITLGFKNILGQKKEVSLQDLANLQKGKGEKFFARKMNQVLALLNPYDTHITDARIKEMMKRMAPETMKQITATFQQVLKEPNKAPPEMLALARKFSKFQGSIGKKQANLPKEAIKQVYDLKQTLQVGATAKMLTDVGVENLLKSIVLEGMLHENEVGFKGTGIGADFIKFYEKEPDKSNIKNVFNAFIEHTIKEGKNGKELKGYERDAALKNYFSLDYLSQSGLLEKKNPFQQIKDKKPQELVGILEQQIKNQNTKLLILENAKQTLMKPDEMTKEQVLQLIDNSVNKPIMEDIFKAGGMEKEFRVLQQYIMQQGSDKLPAGITDVNKHLEKSFKYLKDPGSQDQIKKILNKYPQARTTAEVSLKEVFSKSEMTPDRLDQLIKDPKTKPLMKEIFELAGKEKHFQTHELILEKTIRDRQSTDSDYRKTLPLLDIYLLDLNLKFIQDVAFQFNASPALQEAKQTLQDPTKEMLHLFFDTETRALMEKICSAGGLSEPFNQLVNVIDQLPKLPIEATKLEETLNNLPTPNTEAIMKYLKNPENQDKINEIINKHAQTKT